MAKLIQICASENDLFGLDGDGVAYQYNFNTHHWMPLPRGRADHGGVPTVDGHPPAAHAEVAGGHVGGQKPSRQS